MTSVHYYSQVLASTYGSNTYNKGNYNGTNLKSTATTGTTANTSAGAPVNTSSGSSNLNGTALVAASSATLLVFGLLVFMVVRILRRPRKMPALIVPQVEDTKQYVIG